MGLELPFGQGGGSSRSNDSFADSLYHLKERSANTQLGLLLSNESMCLALLGPWRTIWRDFPRDRASKACIEKKSSPQMCFVLNTSKQRPSTLVDVSYFISPPPQSPTFFCLHSQQHTCARSFSLHN